MSQALLSPVATQLHAPSAADVARVFNAFFEPALATQLVGGADEPFYRPADSESPFHRIFFRADYVASALHETAHWLVAGPERRLLPDWGYWYAPDGRSAEQQAQFERVEVKPQAIEWLLHEACGLTFRVSFDNLTGETDDGSVFKDRVYARAQQLLRDGLSERQQQTFNVLRDAFRPEFTLADVKLRRESLD